MCLLIYLIICIYQLYKCNYTSYKYVYIYIYIYIYIQLPGRARV